MAVRKVSRKRAARLEVDAREMLGMVREMARRSKPAQRKKYLANVGNIILAQEAKIFLGRGQPLGYYWKPLSPTTLKRNPLREGGEILRDTRELMASISGGKSTQQTRGGIRIVDNNSVTIGSTLEKAKTHQYGRRRMRAMVRPYMRTNKTHYTGYSFLSNSSAQSRSGGGRVRAVKRRGPDIHTYVQRHLTWLPRIPARPFAGWTRAGISQSIELAHEYFVTEPSRKSKKGRKKWPLATNPRG